jgi:glycosyltransferase involved in cell wall biosynthesis
VRLAVVCRESPGDIDAIRAHAEALACALRAEGHHADLHLRTPSGRWVAPTGERPRLGRGLDGYDAVLVEYNPFLYGRRGFAPWLPVELALVRLRRRRPRIVIAVHEAYVRKTGLRGLLLGAWQRAQLFAARAAADAVLVSIDAWTRELARWRPRRPTMHLPSGSSLPDAPRTARAIPAERLVVATLGRGHPSHRDELVWAALERIDSVRNVALLALGAREAPTAPPGVEVRAPGALSDADLAASLASADLFLAPLEDGVSTRRTSVMAALQQGLPVVGTLGALTDPELATATDALALAPAGDVEAFAALAARLATDDEERLRLGRGARALYERRYSQAELARIVVEACSR